MLCPACREQRARKQWSPAQWKPRDPWRAERNCCARCEDKPKTWLTKKPMRIAQSDYASFQGWGDGDGPQPPSRAQRSRSRSRSRGAQRGSSATPRAAAAERRSGGISSDIGTSRSHNVRGHMKCPKAIDVYERSEVFERKARRMIGDWRFDVFNQQLMRADIKGEAKARIAWATGKAHHNSFVADPVYTMDFSSPALDSKQATVTIPVSRKELVLLSSP